MTNLRIESTFSFWFLREGVEGPEALRLPKTEVPREVPSWQPPDGEWIPFTWAEAAHNQGPCLLLHGSGIRTSALLNEEDITLAVETFPRP